MRMASRFALTLSLVAIVSTSAHAHPGHAREVVAAESPWHYLLQPEHSLITGIGLAVIVGFVVLGYLRIKTLRAQQQMQPIRVRR